MKKFFLIFLPIASLTVSQLHGIPAANGDLILGFRAAEGQGADTNLQVNLGPAVNFYGAAAGTATVLTGLAVADLVATYGANWNTRPDLSWGIIGTTGISAVGTAPGRTIWASAPEEIAGTASLPWTRATTDGLQNSSNAIATMYGTGAAGAMGNFPATSNSATASRVNSTLAGSWSIQEDLVSGVSFRRFNPSVRQSGNTFPAAGSAYDGTGYSVLDLWEIRPGTSGTPGTLVGGFGLNNAGKLVFSTDITKFAPPGGGVELGSPTIVRNAGGTITVSLANVPDGSYILQRSTTLEAGGWTDFLTQSPSAGSLSFTDPSLPNPRGFYRIKKSS